jgi:hypothetical protein
MSQSESTSAPSRQEPDVADGVLVGIDGCGDRHFYDAPTDQLTIRGALSDAPLVETSLSDTEADGDLGVYVAAVAKKRGWDDLRYRDGQSIVDLVAEGFDA